MAEVWPWETERPCYLRRVLSNSRKKIYSTLLLEDLEAITNNFNKMMMETANKFLGKSHHKSKPWATNKILDMCDTRRTLKKVKNTTEGKEKISKEIRKEMRESKARFFPCRVVECLFAEHTSDTLTNYDSFLNWTFSLPNMVRTVQTLLHSQLACNEMQALAQTCGRCAADSMIENLG